MTLSKLRGLLYGTARTFGDIQAVQRSIRSRSARPIERRLVRRAVGKAFGRTVMRRV